MKRNTLQREAIMGAMAKAGRPLSTGELFALVKKKMPGLGIATVYRALKSFLEDGVIHQVDLPGQPSRWELAGKAHHHHFLCADCNKLFEIKGCPGDLSRLLPQGYSLESHDILLAGKCKDCLVKKQDK